MGTIPMIGAQIDALDATPPSFRIRFVLAVFAVAAVALSIRVGELQLLQGDRYYARAVGQGTTELRIEGRRGRILDRHGAELANSVDAESVFVVRDKVEDSEATARELARLLTLPQERIRARLEGTGFVYLARRTSPAVAEAVRAADLPGVGVRLERRRLYGNVRLAAHVLGFVDVDGVGRWGIERTRQAELQGAVANVPSGLDALRRAVWSGGFAPDTVAAGRDVVLTLDRQVQFVAEEVLERTVRQQRARAGVAIVLDAKTSEVLALASYPTFNPNNLAGSRSVDWRNRAIETVYDPGSTAKIVTIAAALESGVATPSTLVDCEGGSWRVGDRTVRDSDHHYGILTVADVMKKSSNIGAGKLGLDIGRKRLHDFYVRFGFGQRTGIELPVESPGILRPPSRWQKVDLVNMAFGQGVSVTPIQVAQAANAIAAKGVLRTPTIIRGSRSPDKGRRVVSAETAQAVTSMMAEVTSREGTAHKARVPGFVVAGKTGTAQKYDVQLNAYSREKYVASFVGFLPANDPQVTVLVMIDEPEVSIYGGPVAGPAFREIAMAALSSKDLYPDDLDTTAAPSRLASASTVREAPPLAMKEDPDKALERAVSELRVRVATAGPRHQPALEARLSERARALLGESLLPAPAPVVHKPRPGSDAKMPDLRGLNGKEAIQQCTRLGLDPEVRGVGRVAIQKPAPGARLRRATRCTLELRRDG